MIQAKVDGVPVFEGNYGCPTGKYALKIEQMLTGQRIQGWLGANDMSTTDRHCHGRRTGRDGGRMGDCARRSQGFRRRRRGSATRRAGGQAPPSFANFAPTGTSMPAGDINIHPGHPCPAWTVELGRTRIPIKNILQLAKARWWSWTFWPASHGR